MVSWPSLFISKSRNRAKLTNRNMTSANKISSFVFMVIRFRKSILTPFFQRGRSAKDLQMVWKLMCLTGSGAAGS
ncbi:MAG: hypothetical protein B6245_06110 [Desulfobacteraceae bacterium 4572_88]|nr:MAG: hypothetical protein B6245_06110 [Desulfobacteraceae bacterium 4572_88]